jgi:hypothetical protein
MSCGVGGHLNQHKEENETKVEGFTDYWADAFEDALG